MGLWWMDGIGFLFQLEKIQDIGLGAFCTVCNVMMKALGLVGGFVTILALFVLGIYKRFPIRDLKISFPCWVEILRIHYRSPSSLR
jgi:hypothetical protein